MDVDLLNDRKRERDRDGAPAWQLGPESADDDWVDYWLRPVDARDERPSIHVCGWPKSVEAQADADARAVVEEYNDDE